MIFYRFSCIFDIKSCIFNIKSYKTHVESCKIMTKQINYALCVCDALPQALFFLKKWRSWYFYALCALWCTAAGAFFSEKMGFLGFLRHVMALVRSSYVPQALFFGKKVTHKWLWLYLWWERTYRSPVPERVSIHKWLWLWPGPICDAMDYPPVRGGDILALELLKSIKNNGNRCKCI